MGFLARWFIRWSMPTSFDPHFHIWGWIKRVWQWSINLNKQQCWQCVNWQLIAHCCVIQVHARKSTFTISRWDGQQTKCLNECRQAVTRTALVELVSAELVDDKSTVHMAEFWQVDDFFITDHPFPGREVFRQTSGREDQVQWGGRSLASPLQIPPWIYDTTGLRDGIFTCSQKLTEGPAY